MKMLKKTLGLIIAMLIIIVIALSTVTTLVVNHFDTDTVVKTMTCLKDTGNCTIQVKNQ